MSTNVDWHRQLATPANGLHVLAERPHTKGEGSKRHLTTSVVRWPEKAVSLEENSVEEQRRSHKRHW